jgi:hypothetical protein
MAIHAFWRIGPKGQAEASVVVPKLLARFSSSKDSRERAWIAAIFSGMGPAARDATPALSAAAEDGDAQVASAARNALRAIRLTELSTGASTHTGSGIP